MQRAAQVAWQLMVSQVTIEALYSTTLVLNVVFPLNTSACVFIQLKISTLVLVSMSACV